MRSRVHAVVAFTFVLAIASIPAAAAASAPEDVGGGRSKTIDAVRAAAAPVIDGRIDDAVWQSAPADSRFTQIQPALGKPPSERTEFRILYDDKNLYVAVRCDDDEPDRIVSRLTRRDRDIEGDWVSISIDSRNDHASAFTFQLSAAGVQVDGQFFNDADYSLDWDAVWTGAVSRDAGGWNAEFAIPLTVLRFSSADVQSWGVQVHRNVSRKREQMMWSYEEGGKAWGVSRFGYITGLHGLRQKRTFELRPYAMGRFDSRVGEGRGFLGLSGDAENHAFVEAGVDAKLGLTSRLTLDLSVNPDFGQVEADQVVLNLSSFETFFPEKRPFFLEGRDLFETPILMFYPRRIGRPGTGLLRGDPVYLGDQELEVTAAPSSLRLWSAAKITGEAADGLSVAALGAVTGAETVETEGDTMGNGREIELTPERSFGVLRTRYALGEGDFIGATATSVNRLGGHIYRASADHDAYAQALDFAWQSENGRWRTTGQAGVSERVGGPSYRNDDTGRACSEADAATDFLCVPIVRANGQRMGPGTVGYGAQVHSSYETKNQFLRMDYVGHSPRFDVNDAGFAPQFDRHEFKAVGGFMERDTENFMFKGIFPFAIHAVGFDGTPHYGLIGIDLEAQFKNHVFTSPEQWILLPKMYNAFETFDGAHFEAPPAWEGQWEVQTSPSRMFAGYARMHWYLALGDENRAFDLYTKLSLQATSNVEISLEPEGGIGHAIRHYDCSTDSGRSCLVDPGVHHHRFADLDSRYLSATLRATMTLLPTLSFQGYTQWFLADGKYSDFQDTSTIGERPRIQRDELTPLSFMYDGVDDFQEASLNVNLVMRWEVLPGSTLFAVYTRAQGADYAAPRRLTTGPTQDVVLVKFVYFVR